MVDLVYDGDGSEVRMIVIALPDLIFQLYKFCPYLWVRIPKEYRRSNGRPG
jgi:hypothetical protein